ncbi:hypothetical protein RUM43_011635 [Polyplax serrata]|uniref:Uncharacterized protein n=1 Tax=Polyplax serrata TaxID=468196 RepID=A0AAN8NTD0_POLSC
MWAFSFVSAWKPERKSRELEKKNKRAFAAVFIFLFALLTLSEIAAGGRCLGSAKKLLEGQQEKTEISNVTEWQGSSVK